MGSIDERSIDPQSYVFTAILWCRAVREFVNSILLTKGIKQGNGRYIDSEGPNSSEGYKLVQNKDSFISTFLTYCETIRSKTILTTNKVPKYSVCSIETCASQNNRRPDTTQRISVWTRHTKCMTSVPDTVIWTQLYGNSNKVVPNHWQQHNAIQFQMTAYVSKK